MGTFFAKQTSDLIVIVHTGDRKQAGTDANIHLIVHGEHGQTTEPVQLDNLFRNDLERGSVDTFSIPNAKARSLDRTGRITKIEFWQDGSGLGSGWYVDKIVVDNKVTNDAYVFPVFRWIKADYRYKIAHLDTSLPQDDQHADQRKMELEEKRKLYEFDQKFPPQFPGGPVQVKKVPADEEFSCAYLWDITTLKLNLKLTGKIVKLTSEPWDSLADLTNIYTKEVFTRPRGADLWNDDMYFGFQRLAGVNNQVIQRVDSIPEKLPVTDELLKPLLEGLTISEAVAQKRLFMCDLHILEGLPVREHRVLCAPIALFFVDISRQLKPVAIQLFQKPGPDNPIFTPRCPSLLWTLAKMWYNNADTAYHQGIAHLGFTHLIMEGFAVAANRNLSASHPVFKLLAPHFLYIISINNRALEKLVGDGGWVDVTMNFGNKGLFALVVKALKEWRLDLHGTLPEDLKKRGVDDPGILPSYHFRDDAILLYNAISKYVKAYIELYYPTPQVLQNDEEIQNWVKELVKERNFSEGGVGILGVPGNGTLTTNDQLQQIATFVIYTSSVGHGAANFAQYDEYGFPPNYPAMMLGNPPTDVNANITEKDIIKSLPDKATTLDTMTITKILSTKGTRSLGDFEVQYIFDPKAREIVDEFRSDLREIGSKIAERNTERNPTYPYLDPQFIPNSISI
ncbi:unnamed protein product [Lymnaea stagnalis]|uniref:Uncharacterized protein n=1 Tax=Lymnaea stagnalis TaxID=6523 RepID=A0AAV2HVB3_LYMST